MPFSLQKYSYKIILKILFYNLNGDEKKMKKLIKNKKAGILPIAVIVVAVIIIAGLVFVLSGGTSTSYWETENEFGMWQDELIIEFEDGTTKSMKIIGEEEEVSFTVLYGGKAITSAKLKLTAEATGSGYDGAELKTAQMGYLAHIKKGSTILQTISGSISDRTKSIPMDSTLTLFELGVDLKDVVDDNPSKYPDGIYTVQFDARGTAEYRGYPDGGDWISASLPPSRSISIIVERASSGSISLTLYSSVVTS